VNAHLAMLLDGDSGLASCQSHQKRRLQTTAPKKGLLREVRVRDRSTRSGMRGRLRLLRSLLRRSFPRPSCLRLFHNRSLHARYRRLRRFICLHLPLDRSHHSLRHVRQRCRLVQWLCRPLVLWSQAPGGPPVFEEQKHWTRAHSPTQRQQRRRFWFGNDRLAVAFSLSAPWLSSLCLMRQRQSPLRRTPISPRRRSLTLRPCHLLPQDAWITLDIR
jgi:hypothetical protein